MKKTVIFAVLAAFLSASAAPVKNIYGWSTWQRKGDGGKFERIKPTADLPQGAMKFLPDPEKKRYNIVWYGALKAAPTDRMRFIYTFRSSAETNAGAVVTLKVNARNRSGAWYNQPLKDHATATVAVEPGKTQEIALEVDLSKYEVPEIKTVCPMIGLTDLTSGEVTFTGLKVETVGAPAAK